MNRGTAIWYRTPVLFFNSKYDYLKHDLYKGKVNVSITKEMNGDVHIKTIRHAIPIEDIDLPEFKIVAINDIINNL